MRGVILPNLTIALMLLYSGSARSVDIQETKNNFNAAEEAVIDAAIEWWEMIITDNFVFQVNITQEVLAGATRGASSNFMPVGNGRPESADIKIDVDSNGVPWFVDPTPHTNEEFTAGDNPFHFVAKPAGPAQGTGDLLSVVKHELGHALGFTIIYKDFGDKVVDPGGGMNRTYNGDPVATLVPLNDGTHLDAATHSSDLMNTSVGNSQRRIQSTLDRLILADAFGYTVDLTTAKIPVLGPVGMVVLLAVLLLGLVSGLRRRGPPSGRSTVLMAGGLVFTFLWFGDAVGDERHALPPVADAETSVIMTELPTFSEVRRDTVRLYVRSSVPHWGRATEYRSTSSRAPERPARVAEGVATQRAAAYQRMWDALNALAIWNLPDAYPNVGVEDDSTFVFTVTSGGRSHSFTAYSINHLEDPRYLQLYQEITGCLNAMVGDTTP